MCISYYFDILRYFGKFFGIGLILVLTIFCKKFGMNFHFSSLICRNIRKNISKTKEYCNNLFLNIWPIFIVFGCESEIINQGRSYSQMIINISNCFFSRSLTFSGHGGVIYVNGGSYTMKTNYTMFYNCASFGHGGAIYFHSYDSCLVMICANRCSASFYHFAYLVASQMNHVEHLSVSNCSNNPFAYYSITLASGNQIVDNMNSSMNNAIYGSGIRQDLSITFASSHSTFSNNKVSDSICICFYSASRTVSMSYANIVHNNSPSENGVVYVNGGGSPKMMYCIFQNNQNYLFCVESGSIEISHSFIEHSSSFSTSVSISTLTNNSFMKTQTYRIEYLGSHVCKIPSQSQDYSKHTDMIWVLYSIVLLLFVTLLSFLYFYRRIATNLLDRHHLEDSLQIDFG